jgi:hypothetical protein
MTFSRTTICQTGKYSGLDFLEFLRSGETDLGAFAAIRRNQRERLVHVGDNRQTSFPRTVGAFPRLAATRSLLKCNGTAPGDAFAWHRTLLGEERSISSHAQAHCSFRPSKSISIVERGSGAPQAVGNTALLTISCSAWRDRRQAIQVVNQGRAQDCAFYFRKSIEVLFPK